MQLQSQEVDSASVATAKDNDSTSKIIFAAAAAVFGMAAMTTIGSLLYLRRSKKRRAARKVHSLALPDRSNFADFTAYPDFSRASSFAAEESKFASNKHRFSADSSLHLGEFSLPRPESRARNHQLDNMERATTYTGNSSSVIDMMSALGRGPRGTSSREIYSYACNRFQTEWMRDIRRWLFRSRHHDLLI